MKKKIEFENAQELQKQYPETFEAPDKRDLEHLKPGDIVKVCAFSERFWAEVKAVENNMVTARIDNFLITPHLKYDEIITFCKENIYSILSKAKLDESIARKTPSKKRINFRNRGKGSDLLDTILYQIFQRNLPDR